LFRNMNSPSSDGASSKSFCILLVENDPASSVLTREALKEVGLHEKIVTVSDGDQALTYLRDQANFEGGAHPDVIFLDLHLPKLSGLEVLREIKESAVWAVTPVIVVSGSADPNEIRKAYELHASCFIRKPADLDEFLRFMRVCYEFWGTVVTLPQEVIPDRL
jgi:two-component system, chemotaxis family, response regulator Rcp1